MFNVKRKLSLYYWMALITAFFGTVLTLEFVQPVYTPFIIILLILLSVSLLNYGTRKHVVTPLEKLVNVVASDSGRREIEDIVEEHTAYLFNVKEFMEHKRDLEKFQELKSSVRDGVEREDSKKEELKNEELIREKELEMRKYKEAYKEMECRISQLNEDGARLRDFYKEENKVADNLVNKTELMKQRASEVGAIIDDIHVNENDAIINVQENGLNAEQVLELLGKVRGVVSKIGIMSMNAAIEAEKIRGEGKSFVGITDQIKKQTNETKDLVMKTEKIMRKVEKDNTRMDDIFSNNADVLKKCQKAIELNNQKRDEVDADVKEFKRKRKDAQEMIASVIENTNEMVNSYNEATEEEEEGK